MSEELTTVEKEIVEYVETKLGEEDTKYIELYEFGKKLGRDRLVIVLEQLGYTVKWYSDYLFEIERKNKKEAEKMSIINLKEGERKELGKLGLLDLGGKENFGFGVIAGENNDSLHKFSGNDMLLSYNGIKLLRAMESYASLKNYPFNMHISCAGIQYPEGYYVEDDNFKEEDGPNVKEVKIINTLNSVFKDYAFIVSTISGYSVELFTIAKWCTKNDKLYFVSVYDEDDIELVKEEKLYNTIILPKGKFENEAEFLALDCQVMLKYPEKNVVIDDITTLDGTSLQEKLFSMVFKDKLENELKAEFDKPCESDLSRIMEYVVSKVLNGESWGFLSYPQKFNFEYNDVEKYVIVSYEYNENIHQIKIVY